jgi:transcriptional regulator with XRE-family HTH domain
MSESTGLEGGNVPAAWYTLPGRLQWAISQQQPEGKRRGLRLFQRRMEQRAVELGLQNLGVQLSSIQGYLSGDVEPSIRFLREAAGVLAVREPWLISAEGLPTEEEEAALRERTGIRPPSSMHVEAARGFDDALPGVQMGGTGRRALWGLWGVVSRCSATQSEATMDFPYQNARKAAELVRAPLDVLGWKLEELPPTASDTYVAHAALAVQALIMAITEGSFDEVPDPARAIPAEYMRTTREIFMDSEQGEAPDAEG